MKHTRVIDYLMIVLFICLVSCTGKPKVIEAEVIQDQKSPFEFSEVADGHKVTFENLSPEPSSAFHKVVVQEILPTSKYVYLRVSEGSKMYWIATKKMEVNKGDTYYYRNGLLKTNFESKEYNRTFDQLYLVSSIVPKTHDKESPRKKDIEMHAFEGNKRLSSSENAPNNGIISIAELVKNKEQLEGKQVTIKGECTKVNAKIMGRNWIHLKDGTKDEFDLVITSNVEIPVGDQVTLTGTVSIDKDFGSGYYYDLLIENGSPVSN